MVKGKDIRITFILECSSCDKKKVLIRNLEGFFDILLKKIDTVHLVDWN